MFYYSYYVFRIWCVFYTSSTSQFGPAHFRGPVATCGQPSSDLPPWTRHSLIHSILRALGELAQHCWTQRHTGFDPLWVPICGNIYIWGSRPPYPSPLPLSPPPGSGAFSAAAAASLPPSVLVASQNHLPQPHPDRCYLIGQGWRSGSCVF